MRVRWPPAVATLVVTVAVLGPLYVGRGFALRGDMVFVPDQPFKAAWLGLDGSIPRAVPMDALVALVDEVVPGALLQRLLLTAAIVLAGFGIARLAGRFGALGQTAAVLVYLWNPWVFERLAIGQWPTVLGYGLLPWLARAAVRAREGGRGGLWDTFVLLVLTAVCAPSVGLVGALVAAALVAGASGRRLLATAALAVLANLPWVVPAVLGPHVHASSDQFDQFAARGESGLGTLASLVSMGGIWKSSVVPPERNVALVVAAASALALAFLASYRYVAPRLGASATRGLAVAGGVSFLLAWLPTLAPVGRLLGSLSTAAPALGILRDSHRYLAPFGLLLALGAAALVDRLAAGGRSVNGRALAGLLVLAPAVLLPSLVWGLAGAVRPASYPKDWTTVAHLVGRDGGATVVLPWTGSYRGYGWNDHRAVLDPAPRFLPGDVLVDDRVFLRSTVLPGEDPFLRRVGTAMGAVDPRSALRALGIRWVLVEKGNGVEPGAVPAGTVAYDGVWLRLVDLGAPTGDLRHWRPGPPRGIVVAADMTTLLAACVAVWSRLGHRSLTDRYPGVVSVTRAFGRGRRGGK